VRGISIEQTESMIGVLSHERVVSIWGAPALKELVSALTMMLVHKERVAVVTKVVLVHMLETIVLLGL
jgi:hypothetical protein